MMTCVLPSWLNCRMSRKVTSENQKLTVFHEVYTPQVLSKIAERAKREQGLDPLHRLLTAASEHRRIERVHLDRCLYFAKKGDGLDTDRLSRLRNPEDYASWLAVRNELLVPYFFAEAFKVRIEFVRAVNRKGLGDFHIVTPERVIVEVKTPKGDEPDLHSSIEPFHEGLDTNLIESVFRDAARELDRENKNLLVICTQLCTWIDLDSFEVYFYGQEMFNRTKTIFVPDGKLNKPRNRDGGKWFRRISAIGSFNNAHYCSFPFSEEVQQVQFTLLHNYHALCPISPNLFSEVEQFIPDRKKGSIEHINKEKNAVLIEG